MQEDIPENHLVWDINDAVNRLPMKIFTPAYPGGGRDRCHPKMLMKVIIYAYKQRICSSRQIAKAVRENIMFMWLAARQCPDSRTINRFFSEHMKSVVKYETYHKQAQIPQRVDLSPKFAEESSH
ncbi:transposase [Paenibacillus abyssi]|uniref:transposase n=1 Tax=Paenibacillus abyssi TaxID=1340531 RepID=UPI00361FE1E5